MRTLDRKVTIRIAEHDLRWLKGRSTNTSATLSQVLRDLIRARQHDIS